MKMFRWSAVTLLALAVVAVVVARKRSPPSPPPTAVADKSAPPTVPEPARAMAAAKQTEVLTAISHKAGTGKALETYTRLYGLRDFFDKGRIEDAAFEQLAGDAEQVGLARRILTDADFAASAFGQDQATVRVYAIRFLTYMARTGDSGPILETISSLHASLAEQGERAKAQSEDLVKLVQGYAAFTDKGRIAAEPDLVLTAMGLTGEDVSSETAKLASRAVFTGIALGLHGRIPTAELEAFLKKTFPQTALGS